MSVPALLAARVRRDRSDAAREIARRLVDLVARGRAGDRRRRRRTTAATSAASSSVGCSRPTRTRTPTGSSSARSTWATPSRSRSSAARGTSARARRSPSGCPARVLPGFPGPLEERPLRGETSHGMILAEDEIGLGTDHSGIMLLPDGLEPGTPLADVLPLVDQVLDVTPTMNRPDLLSMVGARARGRRAAATATCGSPDPEDPPDHGPGARRRRASRTSAAARATSGASSATSPVGPSPQWLRSAPPPRGHAVDLERRRRDELRDARVGEPAARVRPRAARRSGRIVVRRAHEGETLRTLDGTLRRAAPERPPDHGRRAGGRARGDHGRARVRGLRRRRPRCCSRRRTSSRSASSGRPSGWRCAPRARTSGRRASTRTRPSRRPCSRAGSSSTSPARS